MKVTALIPVYNEEKTITGVLQVLKEDPLVDEILVIDDGSTDNSAALARSMGVQVISLEKNQGKGAALECGIEHIDSEIILMLDGDLLGLTDRHINLLLDPVLNKQCDMTVGIFSHGRGVTDLAQLLAPHLSGQRAVRTSLIKGIKNLADCGYGVELAINEYVRKRGRIEYIELPQLTHVMKEEKRGFVRGTRDRLNMYADLIKTSLENLKKR
ncbi:MAG: glycosyltransferase family 2 protein [Halanaerobiales bacterium]